MRVQSRHQVTTAPVGSTEIKFLGGRAGEIDASRSITVPGRHTREKIEGIVRAKGYRFLRLLDVREI